MKKSKITLYASSLEQLEIAFEKVKNGKGDDFRASILDIPETHIQFVERFFFNSKLEMKDSNGKIHY